MLIRIEGYKYSKTMLSKDYDDITLQYKPGHLSSTLNQYYRNEKDKSRTTCDILIEASKYIPVTGSDDTKMPRLRYDQFKICMNDTVTLNGVPFVVTDESLPVLFNNIEVELTLENV